MKKIEEVILYDSKGKKIDLAANNSDFLKFIRSNITRRKLLKLFGRGLGIIAFTSIGGYSAQGLYSSYETNKELDRLVVSYINFLNNGNWDEAIKVVEEILSKYVNDRKEYVRWMNNKICAIVRRGNYEIAFRAFRNFLYSIKDYDIEEYYRIIVYSNFAWVSFQVPSGHMVFEKLLPTIIKGVDPVLNTVTLEKPWAQLWSRRIAPENLLKFTPPFAVLGRIYGAFGQYNKSYEAFEKEIDFEGEVALGARVMSALIAPVIDKTNEALVLLKKADVNAAPPYSQAHMTAEIEFFHNALGDNKISSQSDIYNNFKEQAKEESNDYYAFAAFGNVMHFFPKESNWSKSLKREYVELITSAYEEMKVKDSRVLDYLIKEIDSIEALENTNDDILINC